MTITLDIAPEVQADLARQAAAHGVDLNSYAASLLESAAHRSHGPGAPPAAEVAEAIMRLRSFGKMHGLSLGGLTIRELRHERRP
jgi:hypothetical protein